MTQDRLQNLALLSIENQLAKTVNFKDIINTYLSRYGNSLYSGQNEKPDDLNTGMPSVLNIKEIFLSWARKPVKACSYIEPSHISL